jgi:phosphohistidine phosphatase
MYPDCMNLYLLRHGIAVERGTPGYDDDSTRPLTSQGKRRLRQVARAMQRTNLRFDLILASPFLRTKQTAEIVADFLKRKKRLKFSDALTPAGSVNRLVQQLKEGQPAPEEILLVGHEPYLSRLVSLLVAGNSGLQLDFKKGGLCKLELENLRAGKCATIAWLLTPKQMKLMA